MIYVNLVIAFLVTVIPLMMIVNELLKLRREACELVKKLDAFLQQPKDAAKRLDEKAGCKGIERDVRSRRRGYRPYRKHIRGYGAV